MVNQNLTATEIGFTHEDFAALLDKYDYHFSPGDVVPGTVFSIEPRGALIDIGAKTAAYIPIQEMSINRVDSPEEVLQSNETREFFILTDENEDGQLTLSIRRIEYMRLGNVCDSRKQKMPLSVLACLQPIAVVHW